MKASPPPRPKASIQFLLRTCPDGPSFLVICFSQASGESSGQDGVQEQEGVPETHEVIRPTKAPVSLKPSSPPREEACVLLLCACACSFGCQMESIVCMCMLSKGKLIFLQLTGVSFELEACYCKEAGNGRRDLLSVRCKVIT